MAGRMRRPTLTGLLLVVGVLIVLAVGARQALAEPPLSLTTARTAITTYERLYWRGQNVTLTVTNCQRHSAVQVSCLAEATSGELTIRTRDWATRIAHGDIRVHPGRFEEVAF